MFETQRIKVHEKAIKRIERETGMIRDPKRRAGFSMMNTTTALGFIPFGLFVGFQFFFGHNDPFTFLFSTTMTMLGFMYGLIGLMYGFRPINVINYNKRIIRDHRKAIKKLESRL